ncbi:MAG: hypothetical protein JWL98_552 [Xanthomonadaceae bacterium]|nr:hypothetical protein [Xanthomonadaceae bacterium]
MSLVLQPSLALWLFAPWFLILAVLYCVYPRQPRDAARRLFDAVALAVALVSFVLTLHWAHSYADRRYGEMWPQVLATSVGYGVFLAVMLLAIYVRRAWLRRRNP